MRYLFLAAFIICCHCNSTAQPNHTKEETIKWLRSKLTSEHSLDQRSANKLNSTSLCIVDKKIAEGELAPKDFTRKIVSYVSWKQDEVDIQNDIFKNGKLTESYTYQVPLKAIVSAHLTNCQRNSLGFVNAYTDRPVFITVKKNSTRVGYSTIIANGQKIVSTPEEYHMNSKDYDWNSVIPIAGNWDSRPSLRDSAVAAFNRLGDGSKKLASVK